MMQGNMSDFSDDIDWNVYKNQQMPPAPKAAAEMEDPYKQDMPLGKQRGKMVSTILGQMPDPFKSGKPMFSHDDVSEMINNAVGAPGMNIVGGAARTGVAKAAEMFTPKNISETVEKGAKGANEYLHPEREAERFRSTLGQGTSSENIAEVGQRVKFAKESAREEALIPKRELYAQEGKSNVYKVADKNLPEGNLPQVAEMIEPGNKFSTDQSKALSKAIANYRKTGSIESFTDHAEDIFNLHEIPEKAMSKVEDALLIPTKRESAYLADKDVADFYDKRGLKRLHDEYVGKPTLNNYDELQSALKKNIRKLMSKDKRGMLDTAGEAKLDSLKHNVKNLNADKEKFMETLPDKMQNLENEFRQKYASGVGKYEDAPLAMRKLAEGKWSEVTGTQMAKLFTNPTKETMQILKDVGPSVAKNILYNALQKVKPNDAKGLAETVLDLKRTKGYDQFVTPEMEDWAHKMVKQVSNAELIKGALKISGGAAAGGLIGGPVGAAIGAVAPFAKEGAGKLVKYLRK